LSAGVTADQSDFVAVHAAQGDEFGGEVVSMDGLLGAVADRARQQAVAPANFARRSGIRALKNTKSSIKT